MGIINLKRDFLGPCHGGDVAMERTLDLESEDLVSSLTSCVLLFPKILKL